MNKPTAKAVKTARENAELTPEQAAKLVYVDARTWQKWEYGERGMMPGLYELFLLKTCQAELY